MKIIYGFMAMGSIIIRQFFLPNPFECFGERAIIINLIAEPVIHLVAFLLVGTVYSRGSFPALGSLLYILAYAALIGLLVLMGKFSFAWWWVLIIVAILIGVCIAVVKLWRWLSGETW